MMQENALTHAAALAYSGLISLDCLPDCIAEAAQAVREEAPAGGVHGMISDWPPVYMNIAQKVDCRLIILCGLVIAWLFLSATPVVLAQVGPLEAQVRSVTGSPRFYPQSRPGVFPLRRMDQIELGSTIVTDHNSSVLIQLVDGSQIKILQDSKVVLREFSATASVRELLEIWYGRVQVKIHHVGGKPNPYRLNSPSASIAVRGTEFIVDVLQNGETTVYVQEGQVEVWPLNKPENKRLVTPGGTVIVRPGGDISLAIPGPGSELNGITRFNSDIGSIYQASVDSLVQSTKMSPP
ncbi:MAG: FecR domain-containing protein, partial [Blastocatellia bacterium]|nr:FecR domain-containing protein [Blastocatellia bacterium]